MTRAEIEKSFKAKGFSCSTWIDPPGSHWDGTDLSKDQLICVVDGEVELHLMGQSERLSPGEQKLIPKGTEMSLKNVGKSAAKWLYGHRYIS